MSTAPAHSNFPSGSGPYGPGTSNDHPARRARQVAAVAAAGTVAALTGFFAVRAAQADDTPATTTAAGSNAAATPGAGGDSSANPWANADPDNGAGYDRGFDIDGDRPAPPDGGFGRGGGFSGAPDQGQLGSGSGAAPALPGGGSDSSSRGS